MKSDKEQRKKVQEEKKIQIGCQKKQPTIFKKRLKRKITEDE